MKRRSFVAAAGWASLGRLAWADAPMPVTASFSILADMTRQVGGPLVKVDALVGPDADVHEFEPRPRDLLQIQGARVLVRNGLGLEGWMNRLTDAAGFKGLVIEAAEMVSPRRFKSESGSMATDPHAWQNPRNAVLYVTSIAAGLAKADPDHEASYRDAAARYTAQIVRLDAWIAEQFAPIPRERRRILTTHDAFNYYGERYGITFLAAEGISTEDEPSAKTVAALVRQVKQDKVPAVFIENMTSPRLARMLAQETGAKLGGTVYPDALSEPGGPAASYLEMLTTNTRLFATAMKAG